MPPMEGLHDSSPRVDLFWVRRRVRAPVRADAVAASVPAWPPPTMITSYDLDEDVDWRRVVCWMYDDAISVC